MPSLITLPINWFERRAYWIAKWTPRHAILGYADGADSCGYIIEAAQWYRALAIQDEWREARRRKLRERLRGTS